MVNCRIIFIGHIVPPIDPNIINNCGWLNKVLTYRNNINKVLEKFCISKNTKRISYCDINKLFKLYKIEDILPYKENNIIPFDLNYYKENKLELICKFITNDIFLHNSLTIAHTCGKVGTVTIEKNLSNLVEHKSTIHNFYTLKQILNEYNSSKYNITIISGIRDIKSFIVSAFLQNIVL